MVEQRGSRHLRERRTEALREEIATILEGELGDPRIVPCVVTEVALPPGGKSVRVFVQVQGTDEEAEQTLTGLNAAKGYIRHELIERLGLRHCPELIFQIDRSQQFQGRIDELLGRTRKSRKKSKS
jgi:ribosome-binding factor A